MNNQNELEKYYEEKGYKFLGCVNYNEKAHNACYNSKDRQWHEIRRNFHLVALHDLKAYVFVDSSD